MSTIRKLFSINAIVAGALVLGVINNIAIAGLFGLDRRIDAYFASLMLVRLFMELIVDYLGKNFLPAFARRHADSEESASELASLIVTQMAIAAGLAAILLVAIAPRVFSLILPGFESADIELVASTFVIMAPSLVFMVIEAFHQYVWQHEERYSRVMLARTLVPLTLTVFIVGLSPWLDVLALPIGFLCGHILCTAALSFGVPYRYRFMLGFSDSDVRKILRDSTVLMGTGVFARSRAVIVQYFGSLLGEGAISAMAIAHKICHPIYQKAQVGIRMIVFSRSAKASAKQDISAFARLYRLAINGILLIVTPVAVWYALEADIIVRAVFQRGAFTDAMANLVIAALIGYAGSVVFSGVVQVLSNGFYAMNRIMVPAIIMPIGTGIFLFLAILLSPRLGVLGLTISASITAALVAATLMVIFRRYVHTFAITEISLNFLKYTVLSVFAVWSARELRLLSGYDGIPGFLISGSALMALYLLLQYLVRDKMFRLILRKSGLVARGSSNSGDH